MDTEVIMKYKQSKFAFLFRKNASRLTEISVARRSLFSKRALKNCISNLGTLEQHSTETRWRLQIS